MGRSLRHAPSLIGMSNSRERGRFVLSAVRSMRRGFLIYQNVVALKRFKLTPAAQCTLGSFGRRVSDECKNVCIDDVGMSGHHALGKAGVNFQLAILEQLGLQQ